MIFVSLVLVGMFYTFYGIISQNKLIQKTGSIYLIFIIFLLSTLRYDGADLQVYLMRYEAYGAFDIFNFNINDKITQSLGDLLMTKSLITLGAPYGVTVFVKNSIFILLMFYIVRRITKNWGAVCLIYLVYPFVMDVIQLRNFYMQTLLFLALYTYIRSSDQGINKDIKFILVILVASAFHNVAVLYLPFVIVNRIKHKIWFKALVCCSLASILYAYIIINHGNDLLLALGLGNTFFGHYLQYTMGQTSDAMIGVSPYVFFSHTWLLVVSFGAIILYVWRTCPLRSGVPNKYALIRLRYLEAVWAMWLYVALLLPVMAITPSMERIPRDILIQIYTAVAVYLDYTNPNKKAWLILACMLILLGYCSYYHDLEFDFMRYNFSSNYFLDIFY